MTQFYNQFDKIPQLPAHLVREAYGCMRAGNMTTAGKDADGNPKPIYGDYSVMRDQHGNTITGATYKRFNPTQSIIDWVATNIHEKLNNKYVVGVQIFLHKFPGQSITSGPHVDGPRGDYVLNYCLDAGGDNVLTEWYQQQDFPILRHPEHQTGLYLKTFEGLSKIHEVKCPVNTWHSLEIRALHTVANLTRNRIALSLGITQEMLDNIASRYN